jgi:hypothetical protein
MFTFKSLDHQLSDLASTRAALSQAYQHTHRLLAQHAHSLLSIADWETPLMRH